MKFKILKTLVIATSLIAGTYANASIISSLSGNSYIDDYGFIAISTNDSLQGTKVASTSHWSTAANFTGFSLLADIDYYIHIFVKGGNYPNNVIGEFSIDSTTHQFANGTQDLGTNKVDWLWGTNWSSMVYAPKNVGTNFSSSFSDTTENIFRANTWPDYRYTNAYFTTKITAVEELQKPAVELQKTTVAEPSSFAILALGLIGLATRRLKKKA